MNILMKNPKFGDAGTVKIVKGGKIEGHRAPCMFAGYFHNHGGDCYNLYNPKT